MEQQKILEICAKLNIGGAQAVAANVARYAGDSFLVHYVVFGDVVGEYEAEITGNGHTVIHMPSPGKHIARYFFRLIDLMKKERYVAVHCHTMFNCGIAMLAAIIAGIPCRMSHSHTTNPEQKKTLAYTLYRFVMQMLIRLCGNEYVSCGVEAGETLYGKAFFKRKGIVIPNGIDICSYRFSQESRRKIRKKYNIENCFVIGHVGHYVEVKNQKFLLNLMPEILKIRPDSILLLFGEGTDRAMLEERVAQLGLEKFVHLMGNANNIPEILSAFDVFVFPSLFEGTPLALIEAQANGLPCIISNSIPQDACLTDDILRIDLSAPADEWIRAITRAKRENSFEKTELVLRCYDDVRTSMDRIYNIFKKYS